MGLFLIGVRGTVKDIDVPTSEIPMAAGVHMEDEGYSGSLGIAADIHNHWTW